MAGTIIRGVDLDLFYTINGYNYAAAHATDCKIVLTADTQETTTKNTLAGKTFDYIGKYSYTLSLEGISNYIDVANIGTFQNAILLSQKLPFIFTDANNVQWSGTVLMTEVDIDSPLKGISSFSNKMLGDGILTKVDINVTPPPIGSAVDIIDQFGDVIAIVQAPGSYSVLRFDNIDGGDASTDWIPQLATIALTEDTSPFVDGNGQLKMNTIDAVDIVSSGSSTYNMGTSSAYSFEAYTSASSSAANPQLRLTITKNKLTTPVVIFDEQIPAIPGASMVYTGIVQLNTTYDFDIVTADTTTPITPINIADNNPVVLSTQIIIAAA